MRGLTAIFAKSAEDIILKPGDPPQPSCIIGEWLIPSFQDQGQFIGSQSFATCYSAKVTDDCDPDALMEIFSKRYTGIPPKMISDFITGTCIAASKLDKGSKVCLMRDGEATILWILDLAEPGPRILPAIKPEKYL